MSRLLNSLRTRVWPTPRACTGIELAGDRLVAVQSEQVGDKWEVTRIAEERLPFTPFRGVPNADYESILAEALARLGALQSQAQPLQFSLPDPGAIFQILEFESLPVNVSERNALARFRLEKLWPAATSMECITQSFGDDQGRSLLFVIAVDRVWLECLRGACRKAKIVPTAIDMTICHVFNQFHDGLCTQNQDGALMVIEPHAWTLLLWDPGTRPRFVRTRWREAAANNASDHEAIAVEVERLVRAYVLAAPQRQVSGLYVCGAETDLTPITERLDTRMRMPCIRLAPGQGFSTIASVGSDRLSPGALAAAVLRP